MTAVTRPVRRKKPFPWKEALRILVLTLISLLMIFPKIQDSPIGSSVLAWVITAPLPL